MSAKLHAAVEATGRKVAKLDELEDPLRWEWYKAQKDGTSDKEADALEVTLLRDTRTIVLAWPIRDPDAP